MSKGQADFAHVMTVDVEEWLNATLLQETGKIFPPSSEVRRNSLELLEVFARFDVRATWFFLGEVAEAYPDLVRTIAEAGHEMGVHGFHHHQVRALSPRQFRDSMVRAKSAVEQASGRSVLGHRAVDFSIDDSTWWALDVLLDTGFVYDASVFPMRTPRYGMAEAGIDPHWIKAASGRWIYEVPITVCELFGARLPFAGGGYFRVIPYWLVSLMMQKSANRRRTVVYLHPCEIRAEKSLGNIPEGVSLVEARRIARRFVADNRGRKSVRAKLNRILGRYRFCTVADAFGVNWLDLPR